MSTKDIQNPDIFWTRGIFRTLALREKNPYLELFWSVFSRIRTEYGKILRISPCLVRMRENTDQNNSKYGQFLRSVGYWELRYIQNPGMLRNQGLFRILSNIYIGTFWRVEGAGGQGVWIFMYTVFIITDKWLSKLDIYI